jgi:hypothetical protein
MIEADLPLMSDYLVRKLNPLQLTVVGFKGVPYKTGAQFRPIFSTVEFLDGT